MALGGGSATPKGQTIFLKKKKKKKKKSFWPLGVANPPPEGQGVTSATKKPPPVAGLGWLLPPQWLLGVDRPPPRAKPFFLKKKNLKKLINSFWPLGVANPSPKGQWVASATLD
jgi:hypothetical protein